MMSTIHRNRAGVIDAINDGVNLVSFGANQMYRQIRPNTAGSQFEVYERWTDWPDSTTWRYRGPSYHEQAILGAVWLPVEWHRDNRY